MSRSKKRHLIFTLVLCILVVAVLLTTATGISNRNMRFECNTINEEPPVSAQEKINKYAAQHNLSPSEWPDEIVMMLQKNPETEKFVLEYPMLKNSDPDIDLSEYAYTESVPLFLQWDQRWGYHPYGDDNIAICGCGPTCLSMVCVYLLHDTSLNPAFVADFSEEFGYCSPGNGSEWSLISSGGEQLGICVDELCLDEYNVVSNLEAGNPIICVMGPGDFTTSGHYIVMTDYIDGKIKINDPNSISRSEKLWDYHDIEDQVQNLWACYTM